MVHYIFFFVTWKCLFYRSIHWLSLKMVCIALLSFSSRRRDNCHLRWHKEMHGPVDRRAEEDGSGPGGPDGAGGANGSASRGFEAGAKGAREYRAGRAEARARGGCVDGVTLILTLDRKATIAGGLPTKIDGIFSPLSGVCLCVPRVCVRDGLRDTEHIVDSPKIAVLNHHDHLIIVVIVITVINNGGLNNLHVLEPPPDRAENTGKGRGNWTGLTKIHPRT